ncbi:hypothetical protein NP233_g9024 [Leucocoprinus birnbaumii]|uniref:F-box domain-containing protein n=1 Tax=Leucocoprinus birnbaumii TaxID=56174 RepID=A0AAD5YNJ5_9AGAR|nr:hypothetical protein NP233_g9024 [Leucocoprinus birnbaumii]
MKYYWVDGHAPRNWSGNFASLWNPQNNSILGEDGDGLQISASSSINWTNARAKTLLNVTPSREVLKGLRYSPEDLEATLRCVLVTPCTRSENGDLIPCKLRKRSQHLLSKENVTYFYNVRPFDEESNPGIYLQHRQDLRTTRFTGVGRTFGSYLITSCSFLILQHLIPKLEAHTFCKLAVTAGGGLMEPVFPGVDYGSVLRTIAMEANWRKVGDMGGDEERDKEQEWWLKLLTQEGKTDQEILKDAWMGKGNMWVFKHPGIFPIEEAATLHKSFPPPLPIERPSAHTEDSVILSFPVELLEVILGYLPPEDVLHLMTTARELYYQFYSRGHSNSTTLVT